MISLETRILSTYDQMKANHATPYEYFKSIAKPKIQNQGIFTYRVLYTYVTGGKIVFNNVLDFLFGVTENLFDRRLVKLEYGCAFLNSIDYTPYTISTLWIYGNFIHPT